MLLLKRPNREDVLSYFSGFPDFHWHLQGKLGAAERRQHPFSSTASSKDLPMIRNEKLLFFVIGILIADPLNQRVNR